MKEEWGRREREGAFYSSFEPNNEGIDLPESPDLLLCFEWVRAHAL